jgi:transposase
MPCRPFAVGAAGRADARGSCSPTAATTTTSTGASCARGITPRIARRGIAHGSGLGRHRWVVERGFAWLHAFKRLRTRYERRADIHLGLLQLACALICYRHLPSF